MSIPELARYDHLCLPVIGMTVAQALDEVETELTHSVDLSGLRRAGS